jgi:TldD protein
MLTRRVFLQSSTASALASRLFGAPAGSTKPNPELENLGAVALSEAKKLNITYCDIRITVRVNKNETHGMKV